MLRDLSVMIDHLS